MIIEIFEKDVRRLIDQLSQRHPDRTNKMQVRGQYLAVRLGREYRYYHRAAVQHIIGRNLRTDEHVHHINGNPFDNRLENLMIVSPKKHMQIHGAQRGKRNRIARLAKEHEATEVKREQRKVRKNFVKQQDSK